MAEPPLRFVADSVGDEEELEEWLVGLDGGRGVMLQYLEPLRQEFGSLDQVAAAFIADSPTSGSVVNCVDPLLFEALGVVSLGHKLMLAKGVQALGLRPSGAHLEPAARPSQAPARQMPSPQPMHQRVSSKQTLRRLRGSVAAATARLSWPPGPMAATALPATAAMPAAPVAGIDRMPRQPAVPPPPHLLASATIARIVKARSTPSN